MSLYISMKNGTQMDLEQKLKEIRQDLIYNNAQDLSNRREWFTRKYRGNRLNDVNVGIWDNIDKSITVQLFLRNTQGWKKELYRIKKVEGGFTIVEFI